MNNFESIRYYVILLNLVLGVYNILLYSFYTQHWFNLVVGSLNVGVYIFFRNINDGRK